MDFIDSLTGRGSAGSRFNLDTLLKNSALTPPVQKYLGKVYLTLASALLLAALGVFSGVFFHVPLLAGFIASLICTVWLSATQPSTRNINKRYALLAGAAFGQGITLGPLCAYAAAFAPSLVLTAFLGTAAAFVCFSAASALAQRRSYLFLGAGLSSALALLAVVRLGSWAFGGGAAVNQLELYGGLLVFCGYIIFDTQVIIEKAFQGDQDHVKAALGLFVDFVAVFGRLVILLKNAESRERASSRDDRKRRQR